MTARPRPSIESSTVLDLEDLLRTFKIKGILTIAALKQLIEQIEEKDRTLIKAKDQILKE